MERVIFTGLQYGFHFARQIRKLRLLFRAQLGGAEQEGAELPLFGDAGGDGKPSAGDGKP